jgi:hypothetical protein
MDGWTDGCHSYHFTTSAFSWANKITCLISLRGAVYCSPDIFISNGVWNSRISRPISKYFYK